MSAQWIDQLSPHGPGLEVFTADLPFAIDTEADSMHHYEESVCLITVRQGTTTHLVDTLAGFDLNPYWNVLGQKEWILHGADFDLRLLRRLGAPEPRKVFDTMLGAQLCGIKSFGYAALVELYFGIKIDKGSQREDWSLRPLPQAMLDYAAQDVAYLPEIREKLIHRLEELGRLTWHQESSARVVETSKIVREEDPDGAWRISYTNKLSGTTQALVQSLWQWRENEAKGQDVPPFKIMVNDRLLELAQWVDEHRQETLIPGHFLSRNCRGERLEKLKEAIRSGKEAKPIPPLPRPPRPKIDAEATRRAELIKKERDKIAEQLSLDPTLIASKNIIASLSRDPQAAASQLIQEKRWCRWQATLLESALAQC